MIDQPEPFPPSTTQRPIFVAGPCSAESREQLLTTAQALCHLPLTFFRAGLWKPRTRPGAFEGVGAEGLPWLIEVREVTGLRVMTEVSTAGQLEAVLTAGVDAVWLGARTVSDPFAVQEIAEALRGAELPVYVKNPISPDSRLWLGAIERVQRAGIQEVAAVFRGFSTIYSGHLHRNTPYWSVAFELKRLMPDMPLLCDPSHITGRREAVASLAMEATKMGFDGLMIESHCNPCDAKSDAEQQILPTEMAEIVEAVTRAMPPKGTAEEALATYRRTLSEVDETILAALARRMEVAEAIGRYKMAHQLPILQTEQFTTVLEEAERKAQQMGIDPAFVERLFSCIHEWSVSVQRTVATDHNMNS